MDAAVDGDGAQGATPVVSREEWKLFRVRPANHPSRRLLGMAALLDRAWDEGLASWSASLVAEGGVAGVRSALTVAGDGGGALIGADRASDLAVNVVLPFARAWGNQTRDAGLSARALALYRAWPPLQENAVTQEAARLLGVTGDEGKELRRSGPTAAGVDPRLQAAAGGSKGGRDALRVPSGQAR